VGAKPI
jgi:hypothetical protein